MSTDPDKKTSKPPTRQSSKSQAQAQDSPRDSAKVITNTVKVAPVKDTKSLFDNAACGDSKTLEKEFSKFREEMKALFREQDNMISNKLQKLNDKFTKIFEDCKEEIAGFKEEVSETKEKVLAVSQKVADIEESLDFQSKTITENETKRETELKQAEERLNEKIEKLNRKLMMLEKHDRKYNLLFYGFKEDKSENIYEVTRNLFVEELGIDPERVRDMYFANGHRIKAESTTGPRPFIIRFTSYEDRELVLSQAYKLGGKRKRITTDLPVKMKRERGKLVKEAYKIRKEEELQTRIRDKELNVVLEVRKEKEDKWEIREIREIQDD